MAKTHEAEIDDWSRRAGRQLRVPRVAFRWPAAAVWAAVLEASAEGPELVWDDKTDAPSA